MIKAVCSKGKDITSEVSEVGARAAYFLIFDDKKLVNAIKNPFSSGGGGAGYSAAEMLSDEGVKMVISGKVGPNMVTALKDKGMTYREVHGVSAEKAAEILLD
ncbi:MAG: NifB/NifX family molybdenum-iron cluster-binding protein [Candidatus Aenigmarchaeota archaeon]|nr:NifB/NifX family molybdenum-iron cluster-binding protein [Candidatus Aenigmarchaeota archaeon]